MFETKHVPVRISNITHRSMDSDDKEIPLVEIACEMAPFTPALASEVDDFVRATLYTRTDAEVTSKMKSASFNLPIRPQTIDIRMAPDQTRDSFTLLDVKVSDYKATRSKKSTAWTWQFTLTCAPASDKQLGQIADMYCKTRYLSFSNATQTLFDEDEKAARQSRGRGTASASSGAEATH